MSVVRRRDVEDGLSSLQALTDMALTHLDVDDLLAELLTRVRDILDADTTAVLMLERSSDQLVARAASGIEEEVRQGVRIPLGTRFAGRIAATGSPVVLNRVDATTVSNPILWEKGIRVMLGVPLLSREQTLGVLDLTRCPRRPPASGRRHTRATYRPGVRRGRSAAWRWLPCAALGGNARARTGNGGGFLHRRSHRAAWRADRRWVPAPLRGDSRGAGRSGRAGPHARFGGGSGARR